MSRIYLSLFIILSLSFRHALSQPLTSLQIDSLVNQSLKELPQAAVAVAVVKDGQVIHSKGYGLRAINTGLVADNQTLFQIASNTKSFIATSLAILVDEEKLSWDDKVVDYIPSFTMYDPYVAENFNILDLLTHRSGLGLGAGDLMFFPSGSDFSIADILNSFQYQKPVSPFRTQFDYDNLLYEVAGEVITRVSGQSWKDFLAERIFEPLGMTQTTTGFESVDSAHLAYAHAMRGEKIVVIPHYQENDEVLGAAGAIISSVEDMTKWLLVHLNGGKYGPNLENTLFSSEQQDQMWNIHTMVEYSAKVDADSRYQTHYMGYGLGWFLSDQRGYTIVSHTGGLNGMLSKTLMVPEMDLGIIVLTNSEPGGNSYHTISQLILDSYLGLNLLDYITFTKRILSADQSENDSTTQAVWQQVENNKYKKVDLKAYEGRYRDNWFGEVEISMNKNKLYFKSKRSPKLQGEMRWFEDQSFAIHWGEENCSCDAFATFHRNENNEITKITMSGISPYLDFSYDFHDLELWKQP